MSDNQNLIIQGRYVKIIYLDINSRFLLDNNPILVSNIQAINVELLNLILTSIGERPFEPEVGSDLPGMIFDQPTSFSTWVMENELFRAVTRWMPNIKIDFNRSRITPLVLDTGYFFQLYYSVVGLAGSSVNFQFNV